MKKVLFGTTALIAAASFAGAAHAEKIKLSLGGKQEAWFGFGDVEENGNETYASTGMITDTEIYFKGSTTLDNGITVAAFVSLEADATNGGNDADETYITMSGNFGSLQLGNRQGTSANMIWGGIVSGGQDWEEGTYWSPLSSPAWNATIYNYYSSDDTSIAYTSPSFFGFSVGGTYTPDTVDRTTFTNWKTIGGYKDQFDITAAFNNEFSGVGIHADVSYLNGQGASGNPDRELIRGALALSYAGFEVGGSYGTWMFEGDDNDGHVWHVAAGYENGPYGVDFNYINGSQDQGTGAGEDEVEYFKVAGKYILGPGINLSASIFHTNYDEDNGPDRDTTGGIVGVALSF
jgi:outer membrane protein OmpU